MASILLTDWQLGWMAPRNAPINKVARFFQPLPTPPMHRYHYLDLARLNRHPKTVSAFRAWLRQAFEEVRSWLEHPAGIDESDREFCTAIVRRASQTACRLGAGDLAVPFHEHHMHASALDILGRLLVWCESQKVTQIIEKDANELTVNGAAESLGVHPKTVRKYIAEGVLVARDAAPPSSSHRDYRIPTSAVLELKSSYRSQALEKPSFRPNPVARSYTPKILAFKGSR